MLMINVCLIASILVAGAIVWASATRHIIRVSLANDPSALDPPYPSDVNVCPTCGVPLRDTDLLCRSCGTRPQRSPTDQDEDLA